jgi:hypothetical protein
VNRGKIVLRVKEDQPADVLRDFSEAPGRIAEVQTDLSQMSPVNPPLLAFVKSR